MLVKLNVLVEPLTSKKPRQFDHMSIGNTNVYMYTHIFGSRFPESEFCVQLTILSVIGWCSVCGVCVYYEIHLFPTLTVHLTKSRKVISLRQVLPLLQSTLHFIYSNARKITASCELSPEGILFVRDHVDT